MGPGSTLHPGFLFQSPTRQLERASPYGLTGTLQVRVLQVSFRLQGATITWCPFHRSVLLQRQHGVSHACQYLRRQSRAYTPVSVRGSDPRVRCGLSGCGCRRHVND